MLVIGHIHVRVALVKPLLTDLVVVLRKNIKSNITGLSKSYIFSDRFYHLDTCMAPLALGHLMFYSGAFDEESIKTIHNAIGNYHCITL